MDTCNYTRMDVRSVWWRHTRYFPWKSNYDLICSESFGVNYYSIENNQCRCVSVDHIGSHFWYPLRHSKNYERVRDIYVCNSDNALYCYTISVRVFSRMYDYPRYFDCFVPMVHSEEPQRFHCYPRRRHYPNVRKYSPPVPAVAAVIDDNCVPNQSDFDNLDSNSDESVACCC